MSNESILRVSAILKGILNPDNVARNLAVAELDKMQENTPVLLYCLINILHGRSFIIDFRFL